MPRGRRKTDSTTGSQPQGGWLRRIQTGAAAAFSDGGGDGQDAAAAPPHMTPRMVEVGRELLGRWTADPARWCSTRDVAEGGGVPLGTAQPLLARYQAAGWVESKLEAGNRLYRLTEAGAAGLAEHVNGPTSPPTVKPSERTVAATATIEAVVPRQRKAELAAAPPGKRAWTAAELAEQDTDLLAVVRERWGKWSE